ncbi:hypothetical protein PMAYCL1PPCAC_20666, partial [Pristionchus mayeri]
NLHLGLLTSMLADCAGEFHLKGDVDKNASTRPFVRIIHKCKLHINKDTMMKSVKFEVEFPYLEEKVYNMA